MNLLYATGIGAAYGIAVINTVFPTAGFGGEGATFFESAALLTASSSSAAGWRRSPAGGLRRPSAS